MLWAGSTLLCKCAFCSSALYYSLQPALVARSCVGAIPELLHCCRCLVQSLSATAVVGRSLWKVDLGGGLCWRNKEWQKYHGNMEIAWALACTKYLVGGFDKTFEDILSRIQYLFCDGLGDPLLSFDQWRSVCNETWLCGKDVKWPKTFSLVTARVKN